MKDKRQGNDLKVAWSIFKQDREPFRLEGLNVSLYLKSMFGRKPLNDFVITGNIIQWTFYGKDQKSSGKYSLEMVVNEGEKGMITTDACDFVNLVPCTCKIKNNEDELGVEIESIELESRVDLSSGEAVTIVIDSALSETSVNPVENRVITAEFNKKANKTEIPTKLSQLEQDIEIGGEVDLSDYPTREEVSETYLPREEFEERIEGYATHDSVQELSENVTELSTRIDNIGEGGSSMFEAIKGETSYEEIKAAFEAKKVVYCHYDNRVYLLSTLAHNVAYFSVILGDYHYRLAVYPSNPNPRWGEDSRNFTHKLETLDNGNAKITIAGKSAEVATPQYVENAIQQSGGGGGTPSGDPMHYMFEAVGATYNATDADIPMVGMYGDSYVHKAHHWCLGEVGDLTNEEIREIYALTNPFRRRNVLECTFAYSTIRTNLPIWDSDNIGFGSFNKSRTLMNGLAYRARGLEVFNYVSPNIPITSNTNKYNGISEVSMFLYQAQKLKKILGVLDFTYVTSAIQENSFRDCSVLEELRIHSLKVSIVIKSSPMLSNASILYMIKNSAATSPIVITLHADAKARAEADAEIVAALSEKTNVTLGV